MMVVIDNELKFGGYDYEFIRDVLEEFRCFKCCLLIKDFV